MTTSNPFGLRPETVARLKKVIFSFQNIERAVIYGSRAMGNYRQGSDIDITLFAPKLDLTDLFKIEQAIDDLSLPYKIDLSLHHLIENPSLLNHIARIGREI